MIYALLSQKFDVEIYALFLQIICEKQNLFTFRMYETGHTWKFFNQAVTEVAAHKRCENYYKLCQSISNYVKVFKSILKYFEVQGDPKKCLLAFLT